MYDDDDDDDEFRIDFADPGGTSALRAGKREYNCPNCNAPFSLTAADVAAGYQCDACADRAERGDY
jgi:DNA-directed RNA polymerase subunit RPC12/RpoP